MLLIDLNIYLSDIAAGGLFGSTPAAARKFLCLILLWFRCFVANINILYISNIAAGGLFGSTTTPAPSTGLFGSTTTPGKFMFKSLY